MMSDLRRENLWVGEIPEVGVIVYDPEIQDDDVDYVTLFEVSGSELTKHDREATRGLIQEVENDTRQQEAVEAYLDWWSENELGEEGPVDQVDVTDQIQLEGAVAERIGDAIGQLSEIISTRDEELSEARHRIRSLEDELEGRNEELAELNTELAEYQSVEGDVGKKRDLLQELSREAALYASGKDQEFLRLLKEIKLDTSFPLRIGANLEMKLRSMVESKDVTMRLYTLIMEAENSGALDKDGIDMAHTIRMQRNVIAHANEAERDHTARAMICLYAASILWPKLSN